MENNNFVKMSSTIITGIIVLSGIALCIWLYTKVISAPTSNNSSTKTTKIEIKQDVLTEIQNPTPKERTSPPDGFGRSNPFVPYK